MADMIEPFSAAQMEGFRGLIRAIFQEVVEPYHKELLAHLVAFESLKKAFPGIASSLDETLTVARDMPEIQEKMHNEYHVVLETLLQSLHESTLESKSLESFFAQWRDLLN